MEINAVTGDIASIKTGLGKRQLHFLLDATYNITHQQDG